MSIADQINRLNNAKAAIKQSITNKGVKVSDSALLDEYPALIDSIEGSGSGEGSPYDVFYLAKTANGTNYENLFESNSSLTSLDVSNWDTSNVTSMKNMFRNCNSLTSLDVSNWDTSNVTSIYGMFMSCSSLTSLDVSNWDTSNVTAIEYIFHSCTNLTSLDLSNWDVSKVTSMNMMFTNCSNLTTIGDLSNWDTSKVTAIGMMFRGCSNLTSLDLSNWDVSKVTNMNNTFYGCTNLTTLNAPKNISTAIDFGSCTELTHDSLMSIINNLTTVTSTKKLTLGTTNLAKLTDEEKAIATDKGWTLA